MEIDEGVFEVKSTCGDNTLGGDNLDGGADNGALTVAGLDVFAYALTFDQVLKLALLHDPQREPVEQFEDRANTLTARVAPLAGDDPCGTAAQTAAECHEPVQQQRMNACAARDFRDADAALNAAWKPARDFAREIGVADELLAAQRAWLTYRDTACAVHASPYEGGSIQPLIHANCLTNLTVARTRLLLDFHGY